MLHRLAPPALHARLWMALQRRVLAWGRMVYLGAVVLVLALSHRPTPTQHGAA